MSENFAIHNHRKIGNHFQRNGKNKSHSLHCLRAPVRIVLRAPVSIVLRAPNIAYGLPSALCYALPSALCYALCSGGLPPRGLLVVPPRPRPPHPLPPLVAAPFGRALVHGLGNNAGQRIQPLCQPCAPSGWTCAAVGYRVARVLGARFITPAGVWVSASPRTALP